MLNLDPDAWGLVLSKESLLFSVWGGRPLYTHSQISSEFSSGSMSWRLVVVCISNKQQTNALYRILPSLCWFLHRQEEQKISKCDWHFCSSHHIRYFQRNNWSKLAVNSISLDSHESKVTCVFLQSYFTGIICISRDHLSSTSWCMCMFIYVCVVTWLMWC